MQQNTK